MDPTERIPLGRTALAVTRLGLGTAPLGGMFDAVSDVRDDVVVATKVGRVLEPGTDPGSIFKEVPQLVPRFDFSEAGVFRSHGESLERMQLNHVDVVHIHDPDDHYD